MGFQIKTLSENDRFFVVDIWTARIKVLLCELAEGDLKILEQNSVRQSRKHMSDGNITDLQGVSDSLQKNIAKIESHHGTGVSDVIYSVQSSALVTDTLSMNYVRDRETEPLDMEEIDSMVAKIEQKSLEKAKPKILSEWILDDTQMKLITTTLTSITIDGKKISNPLGFTGKNVSLTVCNVFMPITSFHLYSSIARKIDKRVISFVPTPITLPKAQGDSLELFDPNCFIDVGHSLTTVVLENFSEILWALQIPVGMGLLENMMTRKFPKLSRLEIEHRLQQETDLSKEEDAVRKEFFDILAESVSVALRMISSSLLVKNIYLSGAGINSLFIQDFRLAIAEALPTFPLQISRLLSDDLNVPSEFGVAYALAKTAEELVRQRTDPIARILRYVIYRYE